MGPKDGLGFTEVVHPSTPLSNASTDRSTVWNPRSQVLAAPRWRHT
ncbi:hypothetical protein FHR36_007497, partial [Kitasatospora paracochleata]|nr:hypothetical protein [Kitasatospora paracochleata]